MPEVNAARPCRTDVPTQSPARARQRCRVAAPRGRAQNLGGRARGPRADIVALSMSDPVASVRYTAFATGDAMGHDQQGMSYEGIRGTPGYASGMAAPDDRSMDVSVRQFVADSGR